MWKCVWYSSRFGCKMFWPSIKSLRHRLAYTGAWPGAHAVAACFARWGGAEKKQRLWTCSQSCSTLISPVTGVNRRICHRKSLSECFLKLRRSNLNTVWWYKDRTRSNRWICSVSAERLGFRIVTCRTGKMSLPPDACNGTAADLSSAEEELYDYQMHTRMCKKIAQLTKVGHQKHIAQPGHRRRYTFTIHTMITEYLSWLWCGLRERFTCKYNTHRLACKMYVWTLVYTWIVPKTHITYCTTCLNIL